MVLPPLQVIRLTVSANRPQATVAEDVVFFFFLISLQRFSFVAALVLRPLVLVEAVKQQTPMFPGETATPPTASNTEGDNSKISKTFIL